MSSRYTGAPGDYTRADTGKRCPASTALPHPGSPPPAPLRSEMFFSILQFPFSPPSALLVQNRNTKGGNLFKIPPPHFIFAALWGAHASDSLPIIICPSGALVTQSLRLEGEKEAAAWPRQWALCARRWALRARPPRPPRGGFVFPSPASLQLIRDERHPRPFFMWSFSVPGNANISVANPPSGGHCSEIRGKAATGNNVSCPDYFICQLHTGETSC